MSILFLVAIYRIYKSIERGKKGEDLWFIGFILPCGIGRKPGSYKSVNTSVTFVEEMKIFQMLDTPSKKPCKYVCGYELCIEKASV